MMRKLSLVITVAGALAVVGGAGAGGPVRSEAVSDFPEPAVYAECTGYDIVLSGMHVERFSLTWYEGETPILERRHVSFSGTFINSKTGKTGAFSGHLTLEFDLATGQLTLTGLMRRVKVSGQPAFVGTGIDVTDGDDNVLFRAGRSLDAWEEGLCAAMA
jgi:hypothetical protein